MNIKEYIRFCKSTSRLYTGNDAFKHHLNHYMMGFAEESGELMSHGYSMVKHGFFPSKEVIIDEMGDYLWYTVNLAEHVNYEVNPSSFKEDYISEPVSYKDKDDDDDSIYLYEGSGFTVLIYGFIEDSSVEDFDEIESDIMISGSATDLFFQSAIKCAMYALQGLSAAKKVCHFDCDFLEKKQDIHTAIEASFVQITVMCEVLNISLNDVAVRNVEKLKKRYPNGFNPEDSKKRA